MRRIIRRTYTTFSPMSYLFCPSDPTCRPCFMFRVDYAMLSACRMPYDTTILVQHSRPDPRSQVLQVLEQRLDLVLTDLANVSHEICNVSARVGHLLVHIVISPDFVDASQHTRNVLVDVDNLCLSAVVLSMHLLRRLTRTWSGSSVVKLLNETSGMLTAPSVVPSLT